MTTLTRKVRAGAPVAEDTAFHSPVVLREARYDTDHDALEGMQRTIAENEAAALWARKNPPKHTKTPPEREPQTDLKSVDWLLGFAFLALMGLSATGLYWLAKALGMVISWMVAR